MLDFEPCSVRLSSQKEADVKGYEQVTQWAKNRLILMDLGYYKFGGFACIDRAGGFFVSRAKSGFNPLILQDNYKGQGRAKDIVGMTLKQVLGKLKRKELDINACIGQGDDAVFVRIVGVKHEGKWRIYITNLHNQDIRPDDIRRLYALRWQVEIFFKYLKSQMQLDVQTSSQKHIVEMKINLVMLCHIIGTRLTAKMRKSEPLKSFSVTRIMKILAMMANWVMEQIKTWQSKRTPNLFIKMAADPHVLRSRACDVLIDTS